MGEEGARAADTGLARALARLSCIANRLGPDDIYKDVTSYGDCSALVHKRACEVLLQGSKGRDVLRERVGGKDGGIGTRLDGT